jgi:hypothetical protein
MKHILKKLVLGKPTFDNAIEVGAIKKRKQNIKAIWNNDHQDDVGIEKVFRLFLAASQFLFPGIYIKNIAGKRGSQIQDLTMDFYITLKVLFPIFILYQQYTDILSLTVILVWLLVETILYVPTLIFASDIIARPSSYRRSMLLLLFNYFEIAFSFGVLYSQGNYLNQPFQNWYDAIYFSFVTLGSIGYGDYYPVTGLGKFLVALQSVIFLAFVVLFLNFFSNKVENKGYFDEKNHK